MSGKRYSDSTKAKARTLYEDEGWSLAKIARQKGFPNDPKIVRNWLVAQGVKLRSTTRRYPRKKILDELKNKERKEVQEKYGCSAKFLSSLAIGKIAP